MKRPAFQFYPADWRKDVELRSCTFEARGFWVDLLCVAHECDPYGHLMVNGKPMTVAQIAGQVGATPAQCKRLLDELISNGVARVGENGVIYNKRMVDDEHLRNIRAEAGRLGGNPNLVKQKDNHTDKQKPTPSSSSASSPSSSNKTPKGAGFDEFWSAYPRKDAKPNAMKAFAKVTAPLEVLLSAIAKQKTSEGWTKEGGKYIPMPASWLNAERWNDGVVVVDLSDDAETKAGIEKQAYQKGIPAWNPIEEQWPAYRERVLRAPRLPGMSLDQLMAMAPNKQGATA